MLSILLTAVFGSALLPMNDVDCCQDNLHLATKGINQYFREEVVTRNTLMIICSLMIDSIVIILFSNFIVKGTTWRIMIALALFYSVKFISTVSLCHSSLFRDCSFRNSQGRAYGNTRGSHLWQLTTMTDPISLCQGMLAYV